MSLKGVYCLCIENLDDQCIPIGAIGETLFEEGRYIYVGSALNSLVPRLKRHLRVSRGEHDVTHWHIDYFLREDPVHLREIYILETLEQLECSISEKVYEQGEAIPHFGCSDCHCESHLYQVESFDFIEKIGLEKWF
ncbi:DUF123 domain-containing protein [Candidatus Bathyarchaeota archaeon]|nr:DUF123 domain-containing protein [Candidatus Bathyarchaeota archaeon]